MKEKDIKKKLFGKRRYSQMEKDYEEKIVSSIKVAIKKLNNYNISVVKIRKRILKTKIDETYEVRINICNSAITNQDYEEWCYDSNFTDVVSNESSLLSSESEGNIKCLTYLTEIFKINPYNRMVIDFFHIE